MAETTPDNLGFGQRFAGWMSGRAAGGNVRLDQSVDRLQEQIDKFSDALSSLTSSLQSAQRNIPGATGFSGGTQTAGMNIGGNWRPAGQWGASPSGLITPGGVGAAPPQGPTRQAPGAPNGGFSMPSGRQVLAGGAIALGVAGAAYTANHAGNLQTGQTIAMMSGNPNWSQAYRSGMMGNYVAHGDVDAFTGDAMLAQRAGYMMGTQGYNQNRFQAMSASAVNPSLSYSQAVANRVSLGSTTSYNRLRRQGINPLNQRGFGDPRSIARQLLQRMGLSSRTDLEPEQVAQVFGPAGTGAVTLDMWVAQGLIPPETRPEIEQEMRNILMAHSRGMSYSQYNAKAMVAQGSGGSADSARQFLQSRGIATRTPTQRANRSAGIRRQSEGETIEGFAAGLDKATALVDKFNEAIAGFLSIPGVGEAAGAGSGFFGSIGGLGGMLKMGMPGGMGRLFASGGVLPGYSPGRDTHKFYSPTGGNLELSGGEAIMRPEWVAAVGGPVAVKAMNDSVNRTGTSGYFGGRSSFASGGTWMGGFKPTQASSVSQQSGYSGSSWAGDLNDPGSGDMGDPVYAWKAGTVAKVVMLGDRSYGRYIVINHPGGQSSLYAHLSKAFVKAGQKVRQGQRIGSVGNLGNSSGPHLHFEIKGGHSAVGGSSGTTGGGLGLGRAVRNAAAAMSSSATAAASATPLFQGGTGGSSAGINGAFSELAALALTGGSALGRAPMSATEEGVDPLTGKGGGGSFGNVLGGGSGRPGDINLGTLNVRHGMSAARTQADVRRAIGVADVLNLSETRAWNSKEYTGLLRKSGWGFYQGRNAETAVAWDKDKYRLVSSRTGRLSPSVWGGKARGTGAAAVLLENKATGTRHWSVSVHTQAGKTAFSRSNEARQYAQIRDFVRDLSKGGVPVLLSGDINNPNEGALRPKGWNSKGTGIDYAFWDADRARLTGFGKADFNTDHPFLLHRFRTADLQGKVGGGGGGGGGGPAANMRLGKAMAASRGWDGAQWEALRKLWMHESGWRTHADNPTSSAYGIPQALTQTHNLGARYKNDPRVQIQWGLNYIKQRYGSPAGAWNFWQRNNWYSAGEWNVRADTDARVHKGEMVIPTKIADIVRQELEAPGIRDNLGRKGKGKGSGVNIIFERGSVTLSLASGSHREAQQAGEWFAEAFANDHRIRALAEG